MLYVDTSVVVPLLTAERSTRDVVDWFAELADTPICADWLLTEFSSAVSMKIRARQLSESHAKRVLAEFDTLVAGGIRLVPVSRGAFGEASKLARQHRHGLRAGDSLHLAVALEVGATEIATLDATLAGNAKRSGLHVVEF